MKINQLAVFLAILLVLIMAIGTASAESVNLTADEIVSDSTVLVLSDSDNSKINEYITSEDITASKDSNDDSSAFDGGSVVLSGLDDSSGSGYGLTDFDPGVPIAYMVTPNNIGQFFVDGKLISDYDGATLSFQGEFDNLGILYIPTNNNVITGLNAVFKNTVFCLGGYNNTLNNLTMYADKEFPDNEYSLVQIAGEHHTITNLTINYNTPSNKNAYAISADGVENFVNNATIINNSIVYIGNAVGQGINHVIRLHYCENANISNNTITAAMPLRNIEFMMPGYMIDKDMSVAIATENCENLIMNGNNITVDIISRNGAFPTFDGVLIVSCSNSIVDNNTLDIRDFLTHKGVPNYLYGIDIYNLENLTLSNNNININTTGGAYAAGTAYPIQLTGPYAGITICDNYLVSANNGPNIGIYSHDYYGETALNITHNFINITGYAGSHNWALVTGIEVQDTNDVIFNNTIFVQSTEPTGKDDNLYAISYAQFTEGTHTYNIQENELHIHEGTTAIFLLSSDGSIIKNNHIISDKLLNPVKIVEGENNTLYRNMFIRVFQYYQQTYNNIDGSDIQSIIYNPDLPVVANGSTIKPRASGDEPLINFPIHSGPNDDGNGNGNGEGANNGNSAFGPNTGSHGSNSLSNLTGDSLLNNIIGSLTDVVSNAINGLYNVNSTASNVENANSSNDSPGLTGTSSPGSKSSGSSNSEGSLGSEVQNQKVYEIEEDIDEKVVNNKSVNLVLLVFIGLLIFVYIGYKTEKAD